MFRDQGCAQLAPRGRPLRLSLEDVLDRGVLQCELGVHPLERLSFTFSASSSFMRFSSATVVPAYLDRHLKT